MVDKSNNVIVNSIGEIAGEKHDQTVNAEYNPVWCGGF